MRSISWSIGTSLIATGLLHTLVGLLMAKRPVAAIRRDGLFNAVDPHPDRQYWFWFMISGWLMVMLGQLTRWTERRHSTLPASLGWNLLAISAIGAILMPISGFWLLIPQGIAVLRAVRRGTGGAAGNQEAAVASSGGR